MSIARVGVLGTVVATLIAAALAAPVAEAMPVFARKYQMSCNACHAAFPRLNAFGEEFLARNMKLPNWKESGTVATGDDMLALPEKAPFAVRAQAYTQYRTAEAIDLTTGDVEADSALDFQAPYLIKLLSSAPLSENLTYYFYGIFAEKGGNGETLIEDAWFRHADVFGTGTGMQLGQFQVSDLMFPRETRLTFQDFMAYRMAGITYDRGVVFDRAFGPLDVAVGAVNGNGVTATATINNPGFARADHLFDNDTKKSMFGRVGFPVGPASAGVFALSGEQKDADDIGAPGTGTTNRDTDKTVYGLDVSGEIGGRLYWFGQVLRNQWDGFLASAPDKEMVWTGGFAGVDYVTEGPWVYSALYNWADAGDFDGTDTVYEGIEMNSLTFGTSYYFARNAKGVIEANVDLLDKEDKSGTFWTGHLAQEHYFLVGFDAAF